MDIQRTNSAQSAAGALLAALAKGDKTDGVTFQREFTDSIDAIGARRRASDRQDQPIEADGRRERPKADRVRDDQAENRRTRDAVADTPDVAAAPATAPAAEPATTDTPTPQADDPSRTSEAVSADPAADAAQQTVPAETTDEAQAALVAAPQDPAQAQEPSQDQGARVLLTALETTAALALSATPVGDGVVEESATRQAAQATGASLAAEVVDEFVEGDTALVAGAEAGTPTEADTQAGGILARRATVQGQATQAASSRVTAGPAPSEYVDLGGDAADQNNNGGQNPAQTGAPVPQVSAEAVSLNIVAPSATADTGTSQSDDAALRVPPVVQGAGSVERIGQARGAGESSVDQTEQIDRIARVMRASISRGGSRVSLQLEPRDIGPLRVQMQLRGSELVARFETQSDAARQLIEQGMQQLRQGLAAGGIQLVDATVETRAPQNQTLDGNGQGFAQQEQADAGQGGGRDREPSQHESHSDRLPWAEMPTGEDALDVMA